MTDRIGPPLLTVAALGLWVVLAVRSPELTYHFAPLVAAAAWPVVAGRWQGALASGVLTLAVAIALWFADSLEGPDLVGGHAAFGESVFFAVLGAAAGAAWVRLRPAAARDPR